ncbi:preprotein translocase subunit SecG [Marinibactrum halimedae]|uniref:Protein-export membrane protein SecG n=1 Tax=Marinibactrum halimedae TaxID=1444977 RepID=A0AA37T8I5_9GAMM|nr:preprotein translocase subunit SecG [Marinibactrum halimedae]MCD9459003.1 preprotein translocase subunit SecG [Marinibactrum halimedae]GLS26867.1 hypothetical protein GCM10007877_25860 [Marinibactrum halimedae]
METIILLAHVLIAVAIIGLILLQQGKGADAGASFGAGASQTVFGSQGGGNFFATLTGWLAFAFFVTSFVMSVYAKQKSDIPDEMIPAVIEQQSQEIPIVPEGSVDGGSEVPSLIDGGDGETSSLDKE